MGIYRLIFKWFNSIFNLGKDKDIPIMYENGLIKGCATDHACIFTFNVTLSYIYKPTSNIVADSMLKSSQCVSRVYLFYNL